MARDSVASSRGLSTAAISKHVKQAFPLLVDQVPSAVPSRGTTMNNLSPGSLGLGSSIVQIFVAAHIARRCYPIISARDMLFCALYPMYLLLANHLVFANNSIVRQRPKDHPHSVSIVLKKFFSGADTKWFAKYMYLAATCGLILPFITIFGASADVSNLAVPHLYVLWCQIIGEGVVMFNPYSHRYVTMLVPVGFSVYRMNLLIEWFLASASLYSVASENGNAVPIGYTWGVVLSGCNLVFWTYNLFVMLLLKVMPEYLEDELCESPDVRVIALPFVGEPQKGADVKRE